MNPFRHSVLHQDTEQKKSRGCWTSALLTCFTLVGEVLAPIY
jgi:hypothetical protein